MDSGPILGVSPLIEPELDGAIPARLRKLYEIRIPGVTPVDRLREIADASLEKLKIHGDHVIFPKVVADFAMGRYAVGQGDQLYYEINGRFTAVKTVEYPENSSPVPLFD